MKILAVGDPHFKLELPYGELISDGRRAEHDAVLEAIHEAAKDCDAVVLLGDCFDKRHNHSTVIKEFIDFVNEFRNKSVTDHNYFDKPIVILSGNHETYEGDKTSIDFMVGMNPQIFIVTPQNLMLAKGPLATLGFIPYMTNASLGVSSTEEATEKLICMIEEHKYNVLFTHHAIEGAGASPYFNEIVLPKERLEKVAKLVVAGHLHKPAVFGKTIVTGNIFTSDVGEGKRYVWKIDTKDGSYEEIELPTRPIFKVTDPTEQELDGLSKNSIIKVILTQEGQDLDKLKKKLSEFDAHLLIENYPNERHRLHIDSNQTLDLSVESLLELYAKAKNEDPERLKAAFAILKEA